MEHALKIDNFILLFFNKYIFYIITDAKSDKKRDRCRDKYR